MYRNVSEWRGIFGAARLLRIPARTSDKAILRKRALPVGERNNVPSLRTRSASLRFEGGAHAGHERTRFLRRSG
jgi:hypothetical protein